MLKVGAVASLSKFLFQPPLKLLCLTHAYPLVHGFLVGFGLLVYGLLILKFETVSSLSKFRLFPHLETPLSDTGSSVDAAL